MVQLADADGMAWWNEKGGVSLERSAKCVDRVSTIIDNASAEEKKLITVATHDTQCYHGAAEREEKAGKLSHNTQ